MPTALIRLEPLGETIEAQDSTPLRELLFAFGVEFPCGGQSRCKRCRVRVVKGTLGSDDPGQSDSGILSLRELSERWRLACLTC